MSEPSWRFRERVDGVMASGGVRRVRRAVETGHAGMPREASLMEHPRLILCLEGRLSFGLATEAGTGEVSLGPRDGLFVAPGRWVRSRIRQPNVSIGIVLYPEATRFYLMRRRPSRSSRRSTPEETHVVPAGVGEEGRALARLLEGPTPTVEAERFFHHAFECLLLLARGLLERAAGPEAQGKARFTWQAACDYLVEHLHRPLSRKDVARHLGVHPNHLSRLFAEFGRETFGEYLLARRIERARLLLEDPRLNIAEVAQLSGFGSANYFARVFRAATGRTPTGQRASRLKA